MTTVTFWIPSEAGKKYEIHWKDTDFKRMTIGRVYIDGNYCGNKICRNKGRFLTLSGFRQSATSISPFRFSHLNSTDDDEGSLEMPRDVGQIELRIQNYMIEKPYRPENYQGKALPVAQTISEKAKKGIDHTTSFSETINSPVNLFHGKLIGNPFLCVQFRYRPIGVLRAHGIAPPIPATAQAEIPAPSRKRCRSSSQEQDKKPVIAETIEISEDDDDALQELERLQARMNELRAKHMNRKDRKKIKREHEPIRVKAESSGSGSFYPDVVSD
ncbi:hypothetical protein D9757_011184 [Collybiopsis confluens]|uniref:DUF7918 domain-containing protein n=1 Tax=Collybiopsis confluens TaxID=2823264 RepID=A0A8H5H377_9AGAR|nr:hypothetical protein D9757_011184 [Collybiopsis confluens]